LCPLGALLGVASSLWSKGKRENCTHCRLCTSQCPQGAAPPEGWLSPECVLCGNCVERCPKQALTLREELPVSLPKRQFLGALLLGTSLFLPWRKPDGTLRPPGAGEDFLGRCVRCGACLKACPTHALQPSLFERGWEGLLTPRFSPRQGYCEPGCTRCNEVCPTGAIKKRARIGLARVDQENCRECLRCMEACPTGALERFPEVDPSRCTGCGKCEWSCPFETAFIRVRKI
ncbi:MAG: 4Fe-4S binding protein, partial [Bacteroidota bacterium]